MDAERPSVLSETGFGLAVLPLAVVILAFAAFIPSYIVAIALGHVYPFWPYISYIVAIALGHVYPFWPYISDTGTTRPESCVFGFFLAWTGFMAAAVFYVRFKQVHLTLKGDGCCKVVNDLAFLVGLLASIGMVMVSAFQETAVYQVHFTGAALAFGGGTVYIFMQTYLTSKLSENFNNGKMVVLRFFCGIVALIAFIYSILIILESF
ncbi:DNA damage-regulated autophagy modulator protein 2 [Trichoplax sp. H2]|nr:DNA damage-regulated autophagy modulator protein 2 [Trichoplax sp. H2]|eukprot:RDD44429.1 DNA damage-regulated autophagy modulator protein 2 [Trichoplax sp. H2]